MKQTLLLPLLAIATAFVTGCYTQLTTIDKTPPPAPQEQVEWVVDSATGDTVKVVKQVDTIRTENNRTCIWERDLMGYPHLRCYDSFYPRDWFYYNNSPWWYRNDPYWYDYSRCPRYYYYDPSIGRCRYTADFYHTGRRYYDRDGIQYEKKEPNGPSGSSMSPRVRGIPNPRSAGGSSSSRSSKATTSSNSTHATVKSASEKRSSGTIVVPSSPGSSSSKGRERSRGVPEKGRAVKSSPTPRPSTSASSGSGASKKSSSSNIAPSRSSSSPPPPPPEKRERSNDRRRRKPRSWE